MYYLQYLQELSLLQYIRTRVAIFRQKNYSAEYGTRRKRRQFHRNFRLFWGREKPSEFHSVPFLRRQKLLEFHSEPFLWREKPSEFRSEPFLDEKNLGITFRTFFRREESGDFCSESFLEEKKLQKYSESHGISTLFWGITKTVPSLFREIFSERNFNGNPNLYILVKTGPSGVLSPFLNFYQYKGECRHWWAWLGVAYIARTDT